MKYRNLRTGAEIETSGKISGEDWQEIPAKTPVMVEKSEAPVKKTATKPVKKTVAKTGTKSTVKK